MSTFGVIVSKADMKISDILSRSDSVHGFSEITPLKSPHRIRRFQRDRQAASQHATGSALEQYMFRFHSGFRMGDKCHLCRCPPRRVPAPRRIPCRPSSPSLWGIPFGIHARGIYKPFPRRSTTLQNHVDNFKTLNYTEYRNKGATGRRLAPYWITEVTAGREAGRLLLFMSLYEKADNANDQNTDLNQIRVCNHCQPPFRKVRGTKKRP